MLSRKHPEHALEALWRLLVHLFRVTKQFVPSYRVLGRNGEERQKLYLFSKEGVFKNESKYVAMAPLISEGTLKSYTCTATYSREDGIGERNMFFIR